MAVTALAQEGKGWDARVSALAKAGVARGWRKKVAELTGEQWSFVKILETDFDRFRGLPFDELMRAVLASPEIP